MFNLCHYHQIIISVLLNINNYCGLEHRSPENENISLTRSCNCNAALEEIIPANNFTHKCRDISFLESEFGS